MSFDKAKAMRNAERFLAQGKIRAAINEYKRVVETDKTDYNTLNMLGDLYAKASEPEEAVICFTQVAEHYVKQGFAQKAIAIYNKISRLKPDSLEVSEKLARLYQMKGSVAEAKLHFTTVAEQYSRTGKKAEALGIWKQIADLDPTSTDVYLKIADACWHDKQKDEAADAYTEAGKRLSAKHQFESATAAFSRALEVRPDDLPALRGYVEVQAQLGFSTDAAIKVEKALEAQPFNRELMELLIDCYLAGGDLLEAERVTHKLMEHDPTNYPRLLDLMKAYLIANNADAATRTLSTASEHLLVAGRAEELGNYLDEILMRNPEQLDAIRTLIRLKTWLRDERGISDSLARLAEAARSAGATEDEQYAIAQLVLIAPQNAHYAQRWQEINQGYGLDEGQSLTSNYSSRNEAVPTFESFSGLGDDDLVSSPQSNYSYSDDPAFLDSQFTTDYQSSVPVTFLEPEDQINSGFRFADESAAGFDYSAQADQWSHNQAEIQEIASADIIEEVEISESDIQSIQEMSDAGLTVAETQATSERELSQFELHNLEQELEGVEFYVGQGFVDLAHRTLDEMETRYGKLSEIEAARAGLRNSGSEPVDITGNGFSSDESEIDSSVQPGQSAETSVFSSFAHSTVPEFSNSVDFSAQFPVSQELENLSSNFGENAAPMDLQHSQASFSNNLPTNGNGHAQDYSFLDDAVEITTMTYDEDPAPKLIVEESAAVESVSEVADQSDFVTVETLADKVEAPQAQVEEDETVHAPTITEVKPLEDTGNDFETRFQTGVAYKEMGLLEDSIREGQVCFKLLSRDDRSKNYYQACLLLADCFMEKQMPSIAVMWYKRAQEAAGLNEDELQGLCYELANAYERAGDTQNARMYFESIYAMDVDYRDVSQRLMNLM